MKKGQIQITFHWIYVSIAGAVILLFFFGIIARQKTVADEGLAQDLVQIMDSIFTGASVAEKTKQSIDTSGLADYTMKFSCDDLTHTFSLDGSSARVQDNIKPFFAPQELQTKRLLLWSQPYYLPYKIGDVLFISSRDIHYVIIGGGDFVTDFVNSSYHKREDMRFSHSIVSRLSDYNHQGNSYVRVVDLLGSVINEGNSVTPALRDLEDSKVSAVSFKGSSVFFYEKRGNIWSQENNKPLTLLSLPGRWTSHYAAIFSGNSKLYECGLRKALQRMVLVGFVIENKRKILLSQYPQDEKTTCPSAYRDMEESMITIINYAKVASLTGKDFTGVNKQAQLLEKENDKIFKAQCVPLY